MQFGRTHNKYVNTEGTIFCLMEKELPSAPLVLHRTLHVEKDNSW
jgi:hypothetical protein